jgi:hypothetical protein
LFDELSQQFVLHSYDVKYLVRAITASAVRFAAARTKRIIQS